MTLDLAKLKELDAQTPRGLRIEEEGLARAIWADEPEPVYFGLMTKKPLLAEVLVEARNALPALIAEVEQKRAVERSIQAGLGKVEAFDGRLREIESRAEAALAKADRLKAPLDAFRKAWLGYQSMLDGAAALGDQDAREGKHRTESQVLASLAWERYGASLWTAMETLGRALAKETS